MTTMATPIFTVLSSFKSYTHRLWKWAKVVKSYKIARIIITATAKIKEYTYIAFAFWYNWVIYYSLDIVACKVCWQAFKLC